MGSSIIRQWKNGTTGSSTTRRSGRAKSKSIAGSFRRFVSTAKPPAAWLQWSKKTPIKIRRFEGNPEHPGSRGRNCAKGPATLNQVTDPERIRYPLKRVGKRGEGKWERVSWDEVLDDIAGRVRKALQEERRNEIMYHVGRPGHELLYHQRILHSWGIDGHNSHTNVCSAGARAGYAFWSGIDRPSPDHANARFILLLSSHLETGHYFNPHAQRIIEAQGSGHEDLRHRHAAFQHRVEGGLLDVDLAGQRGGDAAGDVQCLAAGGSFRPRFFAPAGSTGKSICAKNIPTSRITFPASSPCSKRSMRQYTPEFAAKEAGVEPGVIVEVAHEIAKAGSAFASHVWRNTAAGNLGGWQVARALQFLVVLVGAVGTVGGTAPNAANKFIPAPPLMPPPAKVWNELLIPPEYPLAFFEMSFLLPHFLKEGRGKLAMYFTRVYNPVWTNPDGMSWIEMLSDESKVERHACLTPTWSETAWFADYVLPMGHGSERHDLMSQETQAARWIGFRQPILARRVGEAGQEIQYHLRSARSRRHRPGVGRGRVLDRTVLARRSRRLAGHSQTFRVALRARQKDDRRRLLSLDLREQRAGIARGGGEAGLEAAGIHAQVRRVFDRRQRLQSS